MTQRGKQPRLTVIRVVSIVFVTLIVCSLIAASVGDFFLNRQPTSPEDEVSNGADDGEFEESLRAELQRNPENATAMANLANFLANSTRLDEAIDLYERSLAVDPNAVQVRLDFAATLANAGKPNDAEVQYRRAIEVDPQSVEAHFYLAELYRAWEPSRQNEAIERYRQTIDLAPDAFLAERAQDELQRLGAGGGTPGPGAVGTVVAYAASSDDSIEEAT